MALAGPWRSRPTAQWDRFDVAEPADVISCDCCGVEQPREQTLTWTVAVERGVRKRFCDDCSRTHLRAMEGKLDSEWW